MSNQEERRAHNHYFKDVSHLRTVDIYRVLTLFGVTDPCVGHAVKKLLVAGGRGAGKNIEQDVREAVDSCNRYLQMQAENDNLGTDTVGIHMTNADAEMLLKALDKPSQPNAALVNAWERVKEPAPQPVAPEVYLPAAHECVLLRKHMKYVHDKAVSMNKCRIALQANNGIFWMSVDYLNGVIQHGS